MDSAAINKLGGSKCIFIFSICHIAYLNVNGFNLIKLCLERLKISKKKNPLINLFYKFLTHLFFSGIFLLALNVNAEEKNISLDYFKLRSAKSVSFYKSMIPFQYIKIPELNETTFKSGSCIWKTENIDDITNLLEILIRSDMSKSSDVYITSPTARKDESGLWSSSMGIYFTLKNDEVVKILLHAPLIHSKAQGYMIDLPKYNKQAISVHHSLTWHLVNWTSKLDKPTVMNQQFATVDSCEDFVTTTIYQRH